MNVGKGRGVGKHLIVTATPGLNVGPFHHCRADGKSTRFGGLHFGSPAGSSPGIWSAVIAARGNSVQDTAVQRHSTASCFATYLLPHVLFVADFEERQRIARVCCLAWNIGLFPNAANRERHIEQVLDLVLADAAGPMPRGFRQGLAHERRMLVELKRDLFPCSSTSMRRPIWSARRAPTS